MKDRNRQILKKVLEELEFSEGLIGSMRCDAFLQDETVKHASAMAVINIGELVKHLDMAFREDHPDIPWKAIAGFRDIAAHQYQTLRMDDVYETISKDFPTLKSKIMDILQQ